MSTRRYCDPTADMPTRSATELTETQWVQASKRLTDALGDAADRATLLDMLLGPRPVPVAVAHQPAPQRRRGDTRLREVSVG